MDATRHPWLGCDLPGRPGLGPRAVSCRPAGWLAGSAGQERRTAGTIRADAVSVKYFL